MPKSLGERHNNYLNVKNNNSDPWKDEDKPSGSDERGHAIFKNPAYGLRAGILLLHKYFFTHGLQTISQILARWAPASDTVGSLPGGPQNSPKEYAAFVSARMGIGFNERLEIFDADKSLGNLAHLRDLIFAMAAYENGGGFEVPVDHWNAALELIQPGVTTSGTSFTEAVVSAAINTDNVDAADTETTWHINNKVGRWNNGAVNHPDDVETIQHMLRNAAMILREPRLDPGAIDGEIHINSVSSDTVQAIEAFQSRFFAAPDGVIAPSGRTWRELKAVIDGPAEPVVVTAAGSSKFFFPFVKRPSDDWGIAPRCFGARRDGGKRAHAGCDLYASAGTVIHALTDGVVVRGPYEFYAKTFAIEIDHGDFLARYGEVQQKAFVGKGDKVKAGQPIALVGHLVGISVASDMLHLELYDKSVSGPLTVSASESARTATGVPYLRRRDLIDPSVKLNEWVAFLPGAPAAATPATSGSRIPSTGFCIHLKREWQEAQRVPRVSHRTIGSYQCYWNGTKIDGLEGQMVERGGPGDNTTEVGNNHDRRLRAGRYRLKIHHGTRYKTYGYRTDTREPRPGLLLGDTDERTAILIHPGHGFLSSIGCLNPTTGLTDIASAIDLDDSCQRTISLIDAMKDYMGVAFPKLGIIPNAIIVIEGEPV